MGGGPLRKTVPDFSTFGSGSSYLSAATDRLSYRTREGQGRRPSEDEDEDKGPFPPGRSLLRGHDSGKGPRIPLHNHCRFDSFCMSCQAGRHTGLAVCLAGVTSLNASAAGSATASTVSNSSPARSLSWRQVLRHGQFTLLRTHRPLHHHLRVLQTAASVVAISSCTYLTSSEPRAHNQKDSARNSSSFPHLSSLRSKMVSLPALMAVVHQRRGLEGSSGDRHDNHDHSHSHSHGHGHGHIHSPLHHHHHDNAYLTSSNKSDPGVRITRLGLLSNLGMAIAKFIGGWAFNSKAMTADAWHSITDLASDVLTLATVSWSLKTPTDRFPMGFGKVESLGALGVSGMLLGGGMYMGWESGIALYGHFYPEAAHNILEHVGHAHSHSHSASALGIPSMHAAWLAAGTILIKEWLYHASK